MRGFGWVFFGCRIIFCEQSGLFWLSDYILEGVKKTGYYVIRFSEDVPEEMRRLGHHEEHLEHHGVAGQKWGVRNGPPYPLNRKLAVSSKDRVFLSGSSKMQTTNSGFYRKVIPKSIRDSLDDIRRNGARVLIGDAPGFDSMVQDYFAANGYRKVDIYVTGDEVRKNADADGKLGWRVHHIDGGGYEKGSAEWHAEKDRAMTKDSTQSLAVVIENGASATRRNIQRSMQSGKPVLSFELSSKGSDYDRFILPESEDVLAHGDRLYCIHCG